MAFRQDPDVLQEYNAVFMEQSENGMIEGVPEKNVACRWGTLYSP